jgi:hypothetical protein
MEGRDDSFPSWFPILSVAFLSGALGWWLGRRESKILAAAAGFSSSGVRLLSARTGDDQYGLNEGTTTSEDNQSSPKVTAQPDSDEGGEAWGQTMDAGVSATPDSSSDGGGQTSNVSMTPESSKDSGGVATKAPAEPVRLLRRAPSAIYEAPPTPSPKLKTTEQSAQAQSSSSSPPTMVPVTMATMEQPQQGVRVMRPASPLRTR